MRLAFWMSIAVLTALISTTDATMILAFRTTLTIDKEPPRKVTVLVADLLRSETIFPCENMEKKIIDEWHTFHNKIHDDYIYEALDPFIKEQREGLPKVIEFGGLLAAFSGTATSMENARQQKPKITALKSNSHKINLIASLLYNIKKKRPWDTSAIVVTPFGHISLLEAVDGVKNNVNLLNLPIAMGYGEEVVLNQINSFFGDENAPVTAKQLKSGLRQIFRKLMVFQRKTEYLYASENFSGFAMDDKGQTLLLENLSNPTNVKPFVRARQKRLVPPGPRKRLTQPNLPYFKSSIKPRRSSKANRQKTCEMI